MPTPGVCSIKLRIKRKYRRTAYKHKRFSTRAAWRKRNRKRKRSSLETLVASWLKEDKIAFKQEHAIGRCHVDVFIEPRTLIELNGCFWHGCMICNRVMSQRHKIAQIKDARRYAYFRRRGFDVFVIWECEVDNEPDRVREVLRALAKPKKEPDSC